MFEPLRKLFRPTADAPLPSMPAGTRAYVIGDIHGRDDLFAAMVDAVEADAAGAASEIRAEVILLGDLIDRGPASAQVVQRAREWQARMPVRILAGNHEEMFLQSFRDIDVLRHFLKHGGRETILSYGVDEAEFVECTRDELQGIMDRAVPRQDRDFLASFEDCLERGDYLFVHAGIRPGVDLEDQKRHDFLWIREPFLRHAGAHSHVVVHGHTIAEGIDERDNRIGIDTGAFRTGCLTALVLEGSARRFIQAVETDGRISIEHKVSHRDSTA